ncbi:hypothetical protein BDP27DRAFT_1425859 [Rhodocollybia butyracea]|uniref:Uncharacterized protein n=1 Tax=Rhodocollybia butyracea TaxID=206335 RepID=A0A9P5PFN0_9AGAR|nr:hypothetical protein BDP27DRAFT_1425859 [Rhodocollybia butyracea]
MVKLDLLTHLDFFRGVHPLLGQLFGQIVHWQSLSVQCENYSFEYFLDHADIWPASFLALGTLCLFGVPTPFINTAPNLQTLNLPHTTTIICQHDRDPLPIELDIQNIFDTCSNLCSLGLTEHTLYGIVSSPMTPPCSSKIEVLTVWHCDGYWADPSDPIHPLLRLPSLKVLHLEKSKLESEDTDYGVQFGDKPGSWEPNCGGLFDDEPEPWPILKPFVVVVRQSCFQLTTFSIQCLSISDDSLVQILILLPTLQDLTIDDSGISPKCSPISSKFIDSLHAYCSRSLHPQTVPIIP